MRAGPLEHSADRKTPMRIPSVGDTGLRGRHGAAGIFQIPRFGILAFMIRTVEAVIDEAGRVVLKEPLQLPHCRRAIVTILDEEPITPHGPQQAALNHETTLLSERALAEDWCRPEEDAAWAHLPEAR